MHYSFSKYARRQIPNSTYGAQATFHADRQGTGDTTKCLLWSWKTSVVGLGSWPLPRLSGPLNSRQDTPSLLCPWPLLVTWLTSLRKDGAGWKSWQQTTSWGFSQTMAEHTGLCLGYPHDAYGLVHVPELHPLESSPRAWGGATVVLLGGPPGCGAHSKGLGQGDRGSCPCLISNSYVASANYNIIPSLTTFLQSGQCPMGLLWGLNRKISIKTHATSFVHVSSTKWLPCHHHHMPATDSFQQH